MESFELKLEAIKINQGIINRMAENSYKMKTIFISMSGLLISFLDKLSIQKYYFCMLSFKVSLFMVAYIIISCCIWYIDARYLKLERQFREHHNAILNKLELPTDLFNFNPMKYTVSSSIKLMIFNFSTALYTIIIITITILISIMLNKF